MRERDGTGDGVRGRTQRKVRGINGQGAALGALVAVAVLVLALAGTILLPPSASVHTTMKILRFNNGSVPVNDHAHGCGSYWDTRQVGHGIGATIQLAAGFCWNGKSVWWTWGLHRANCYPIATEFTQVHMTCQIRGGGHSPINVTYEARVASSVFPFVSGTVTLQLIVTPQGYVLQLPFQPI